MAGLSISVDASLEFLEIGYFFLFPGHFLQRLPFLNFSQHFLCSAVQLKRYPIPF